jgi:hypothetical protein
MWGSPDQEAAREHPSGGPGPGSAWQVPRSVASSGRRHSAPGLAGRAELDRPGSGAGRRTGPGQRHPATAAAAPRRLAVSARDGADDPAAGRAAGARRRGSFRPRGGSGPRRYRPRPDTFRPAGSRRSRRCLRGRREAAATTRPERGLLHSNRRGRHRHVVGAGVRRAGPSPRRPGGAGMPALPGRHADRRSMREAIVVG